MPLDTEKNFLNEANHYYNIGRYQDALERYNQLLAYQPNNGMFLFLRAGCLYRLKRNDEAVQTCMQALENGYMEDKCNYLLGIIFTYGMARYTEGKNCFIEALRISPQRADIIADYGFLMNRIGDNTKALELIDKALLIDPYNERALHHKFFFTYFYGDRSELPALLERYLQTSASEKSKLEKASIVEVAKRDYITARENCRQAFLLNPTDTKNLRLIHAIETPIHETSNESENSKDKVFDKRESIRVEKQLSKLKSLFHEIIRGTGSPPKE